MRNHLYPPGINPGEAEYQISPQPRQQKPYTSQASRNLMQKGTNTAAELSITPTPNSDTGVVSGWFKCLNENDATCPSPIQIRGWYLDGKES